MGTIETVRRIRVTTLTRETFGYTVRVSRTLRRQARFPVALRYGGPKSIMERAAGRVRP